MKDNPAAIWLIAEHHLAYQACQDWTRDFLDQPGRRTWKIHLNPAPKATRQAGCAILLDTSLINTADAEGPHIIVPGHISSWYLPQANLSPQGPIPTTIISVYLPYQRDRRERTILQLRSYLHTLHSIFVIGGDFNIHKSRFIRTPESWGYAQIGNHSKTKDIDYVLFSYRRFALPHRPQLEYLESRHINWDISDHPDHAVCEITVPVYNIISRRPSTNWKLLQQEEVQNRLREALQQQMPPPDASQWHLHKQIALGITQRILFQHRLRTKRREKNN